MEKTFGQVAYEAYCAATGWKSAVSGDQLPEWKDVRPAIKTAWEAAGDQVLIRATPASRVVCATIINEAVNKGWADLWDMTYNEHAHVELTLTVLDLRRAAVIAGYTSASNAGGQGTEAPK